MDLHEKCRIAFVRQKWGHVHVVDCRKKRTPVVLKMPLRSRIARPHALFRDRAQLRLIYRLRISGSRFHRERERLRRDNATATFVCTYVYCMNSFDSLIQRLYQSFLPTWKNLPVKDLKSTSPSYLSFPPSINHASELIRPPTNARSNAIKRSSIAYARRFPRPWNYRADHAWVSRIIFKRTPLIMKKRIYRPLLHLRK